MIFFSLQNHFSVDGKGQKTAYEKVKNMIVFHAMLNTPNQ